MQVAPAVVNISEHYEERNSIYTAYMEEAEGDDSEELDPEATISCIGKRKRCLLTDSVVRCSLISGCTVEKTRKRINVFQHNRELYSQIYGGSNKFAHPFPLNYEAPISSDIFIMELVQLMGASMGGHNPVLFQFFPFVYSECMVSNCNFHFRYIIEIEIISIKGSFALFASSWGTNVLE